MRKIRLLAFLTAATLGATTAYAQDLALDHSGGQGYIRGSFANFGWTFTTAEARTVTALGLFDRSDPGLANPHEVGIWDAGGTLLMSTIVQNQPLTPSASLAGDWRFADISPTFLAAGNYTIGAYYPTNQDALIASSDDVEPVLTTASWLTFGQAVVTTGGTEFFTRPVTPNSETFNPGWFGPNFLSIAAVPEPATWAMLLIGFAAVGGAMRSARSRKITVSYA